MREASPQLILIMTLTFFLAGMVKGVTGMGLPTVAMGVLGAVIPPVAAASMLIIPSFVTNVWQLYAGPRFADLVLRLCARHRGGHHRRLMAANKRQHRMDYLWAGSCLSALCRFQPFRPAVVGPRALRALAITPRRPDNWNGHGRHRRFRHSRCSLSPGARPGQGRSHPSAWVIVHHLDSCTGDWTSKGRRIPFCEHRHFCARNGTRSDGYVVRTVDPSAHCRGHFSALVPDLPCPSWSRTHRSAISLMQKTLGGGFDA
jgi:hypothetical protein